jgi:DNA invertase Pin-like site-specific DNA recombinase
MPRRGCASGSLRRAAIYARVSTGEQDTGNQIHALQLVAERHGWTIVEIFEDAGISGAKGRDQRPAVDRMMRAVARREFDVVMAWSLDRLGRSLQHLLTLLAELEAKQVDLYLDRQGVDTTTPGGRALFQMMGVFAEFERAMIRERVKVGLARAAARGAKLGRPQIPMRKEYQIREAKAEGLSIRQVAARCGVSIGTAHRVCSS